MSKKLERISCHALLTLAIGTIVVQPATAADLVLPRECVTAELDAAEKIRELFSRTDVRATWLLGGSLAIMKAARGDCVSGRVDRAVLLYGRLFEAFRADEAARAAEVAAIPGENGSDP